MRILNYMNLNRHPAQLSFRKDRTDEFAEIYHAHQGMEWLYVHEGQGQIIVNQQIAEVFPGSLVVFRPFELHRVRIDLGQGKKYVRSLFVFEPAELDRHLAPFPALREFFAQLWKDPLETQVLSGLPRQTLDELFADYEERIAQAPAHHVLEEQMLFLIALLQVLKRHWKPAQRLAPVPARRSSAAEQVMRWIEEHYAEPFDLKRLAAAVHLTPNHVSAAFRRAVGSSITEYLIARRIRQACLLLRTTDLSVQEVCQAVGLTNCAYFCSLFKKHVGLTPYRYKRSFDPRS